MVELFLIILTFIIYLFYERKNREIIIYQQRCESYIEQRLFDELKKNGFQPIPQVKCGPYRIDIALPKYRLAIECDGEYWHSSPEAKRRDAKKNYYLKKKGWKVCRFKGKTINKRLNYCINHIKKRAYH